MKTISCRAGNETFEKLATLGLLANIMVYLQDQFHMKQVFATNVINIWSGTTNFAPLIGAFLSDAYFGRFRTLAYASIASFLVRFEVVQNPPNICCIISQTFSFFTHLTNLSSTHCMHPVDGVAILNFYPPRGCLGDQVSNVQAPITSHVPVNLPNMCEFLFPHTCELPSLVSITSYVQVSPGSD